jgi:hypothetical protein
MRMFNYFVKLIIELLLRYKINGLEKLTIEVTVSYKKILTNVNLSY